MHREFFLFTTLALLFVCFAAMLSAFALFFLALRRVARPADRARCPIHTHLKSEKHTVSQSLFSFPRSLAARC